MRAIKFRSPDEGIAHHVLNPVREYADCSVHSDRIRRAAAYLNDALVSLQPGPKSIVELGCGTMDISGPFSDFHEVIGSECNEHNARRAEERFKRVTVCRKPIEEIEPFPCDVLILCEILEHLYDPLVVVKKWLPIVKAAIISHPLDEALDSTISGGDHQWSFTERDLTEWFGVGGHNVVKQESFQMGSYRIGIARGKRVY